MKRIELVNKLEAILNNKELKATERLEQIAQFVEEIKPAQIADEGKITYFITVNERKMDPNMKYPKQMLTCHDILIEKCAGPGAEVDRAQVMEWIGEEAERLNTRQSPERIFAFYQKRMEDEGWLTRSKVRM